MGWVVPRPQYCIARRVTSLPPRKLDCFPTLQTDVFGTFFNTPPHTHTHTIHKRPLPFPWAAGTDAGDKASTFVDPSITGQHGFATVTRLSGKKEILMITNGWSSSKTRTTLEAWRAADEFNGGTGLLKTHAWMCHSKAYATSEWSTSGKQWIEPSYVLCTDVPTAAHSTCSLLD